MNSDDPALVQYRPMLHQLLTSVNANNITCFYKRYKSVFITYHSLIYDHPFSCNSHTVSFADNDSSNIIHYGNIIIFLLFNDENFALIQKYVSCEKKLSNNAELPNELHKLIDNYYPLVSLSNNFIIVPVKNIRHKCICVPIFNVFCISEIRIDHEHD